MLEMAEKEHKLKMEILSIKKECALSKIENCKENAFVTPNENHSWTEIANFLIIAFFW